MREEYEQAKGFYAVCIQMVEALLCELPTQLRIPMCHFVTRVLWGQSFIQNQHFVLF